MFKQKSSALDAPECLETTIELCGEQSYIPEIGYGVLEPLNKAESIFNRFIEKLPQIGALTLVIIAVLIFIDVVAREFFGTPIDGITDLESLAMVVIGFTGMAWGIACRQSLQIDLFFDFFSSKNKKRLYFFANLLGLFIAVIMGWQSTQIGWAWMNVSPLLKLPEWPIVLLTGFCISLCAIAFLFQVLHGLKSLLINKDYLGLISMLLIAAFLCYLPFLYKAIGIKLSPLLIGTIGFCILMFIMLIRVPIGWSLCLIGFLGLLIFTKRPSAALHTLGSIPFDNTASFIMVAFPMFMLMGEMAFLSGLSSDLFDVANKWLGKMPGGLAVASVSGCAGFGAVCGDSMATCITMSSVAMEPMKENGYSMQLAAGSIAAGGTLGILIPPSMGFIVYSMLTEESIAKLFVAGIVPGILLTLIFITIIYINVKRNPSLAPKSKNFPLSERLLALPKLIPLIVLFGIVVGGILYGKFTPGEGGAVGAVLCLIFAIIRRKMTFTLFVETVIKSACMFGKLFILFVGLYVFQAFLSSSRLPSLLADFIIGLEVNRYVVLAAIISLYIVLGCVMNIIPMMMLTLPSIFPTVQALGFDGIWFGVVAVIVMEMGMITPPVGMNVFTMSSLHPDIPLVSIFKGVLPFFVGMLLCVLLIIIFPDIALFLPNILQ